MTSMLPDRGVYKSSSSETDVYGPAFTYPWLTGIPMLARPTATSKDATIPKSIKIPSSALHKMTGMERQYWELKAAYFDVVIFWKKGKFYELYDGDAVLAHKEFGLRMTQDMHNRGKMRMSGVPEQSFNQWARLFVHRGYRIGRVEQMALDDAPPRSRENKTIPRELVAIITPGTITDPTMLGRTDEATFILSIAMGGPFMEAVAADLTRGVYYYSVVPTLDALATLLHHLRPVEVLFNSTNLSSESVGLLHHICCTAAMEDLDELPVSPSTEIGRRFAQIQSELSSPMPDAWLHLSKFFCYLKLDVYRTCPIIDQCVLHPENLLTSDTTFENQSSLGFVRYDAHLSDKISISGFSSEIGILETSRRFDPGLSMDAAALESLEVVTALDEDQPAETDATFLKFLIGDCQYLSPGGSRKMRRWVLRPSAHPKVIHARQSLVRILSVNDGELFLRCLHNQNADLEAGEMFTEEFAQVKKLDPNAKLPELHKIDFERLLSRLADAAHENIRVSFIDPLLQYKSKIQALLDVCNGFLMMATVADKLQSLTETCVNANDAAGIEFLNELLKPIDTVRCHIQSIGINHREILERKGYLLPKPGEHAAYDEALQNITEAEEYLVVALKQHRSLFGANVTYSSLGKDNYLLDVPTVKGNQIALKKLGVSDKFVERARTARVVKLQVIESLPVVARLNQATTQKQKALVEVLRQTAKCLCEKWDLLYDMADRWSTLEVLGSLAMLKVNLEAQGMVTCFPRFMDVSLGDFSCVEAKGLYHPMVHQLRGQAIPNDFSLGVSLDQPRVLLLTGPNMAGKSTLMRTVAVAILLGQLGGPVCAQSCNFGCAPFDRIFTRIGARDAMHRGYSTLRVEMEETNILLREANARSLCLIDELGRGTSTHDGAALARASLMYLASMKPSPLVMFSTHYHSLALQVAARSPQFVSSVGMSSTDYFERNIQMAFMNFELMDDGSRVVFLYKLVDGICGRSHGIEVARQAGIPEDVLNRATKSSIVWSQQVMQEMMQQFIASIKRKGTVLNPTDIAAMAQALLMLQEKGVVVT